MTAPHHWLNVDDALAAARSRLPKGLFQAIEGGAEEDVALANNREAIRRVKLRTNILRDVSQRSTRTTLFGKTISMPVIVAPTGPAGLVWHRGEVAMAQASEDAGVPFTVSTASLSPMEAIRRDGGGDQWFQLYISPDRELSFGIVDRARDAGYETLVVTLDSIVPYNRPRDIRNGFAPPIRVHRRNAMDLLTHPRWLFGVMGRYVLTSGIPRYENYPGTKKARITSIPIAAAKNTSLVWKDLDLLRQRWAGPLIVKGISTPEDANQAIICGADGIVVSNHGGIAFDSAVAPIDVLEEVADAVAGRATVIVDSGFRRGSDVAKALCLGADAVMVGRLPLMGLAAAGRVGAARALKILQAELAHTMAVMGCVDVKQFNRTRVWRP